LNKDYICLHFKTDDEKFNFIDFCNYFNMSLTTAYRYLQSFNISYKSITNIEETINKSLDSNFEIKNKEVISSINNNKINKLELDLFQPFSKLAIEYNGLMYHSFGMSKHTMFNNYEIEKNKYDNDFKEYERHLMKTIKCEQKGIQLFHIFENEWLDEKKRNIWISMINNKTGSNKTKRIFARKCFVEILNDKNKNPLLTNQKIKENNKIAKEFEESNHLQGYINSSIKIGLFYIDRDTNKKELLSLMTFGKSRFNKNYEYELYRFCTKINYQIVGGASKLLKKFEIEYSPKSLISYANRRWSTGNLYKKLNFNYIGTSTPNFFYFLTGSKKLKSRNSLQKHKLKELFNENIIEYYNSSETAVYNAFVNKYRRIWDSGNLIFDKFY